MNSAPIRANSRLLGKAPLRLVPFLWTLALGLWGLSRQHSVWRDEAATWQVARRSTGDIWQMLAQVDAVHGLYYLLMHAVFECFDPGTTALRLPSVLGMAVAAVCVAEIGRRLAGIRAGLAAGLALGLLPAVQFHLQEGRPYALVAAGAGISTLLLVAVLQGRGRAVHWLGYAGTVAVCGLLNWLSLLILPAHLATLVWTRARRRTWTGWALASAPAVAAVLPLILFSRRQSEQVSWIPPLTWHMLIGPAVLLAIGGLGALLDRPHTGRLSVAAVGLPLLAVPQLGLLGLSLVRPLFLDRYILFSMLGLALLIGTAPGETRAVSRRAAGTKTTASPVSFSRRTSVATARTSSTRLSGERLASDCGSSATNATATTTGTSHAEARGWRGPAARVAVPSAVPISRARPSMLNRM